MPQPEKPLNPEASPQQWFGAELRRARKEARMSARDLGLLAQVSGDMILLVEKGAYPSLKREVAGRLDKALDTGGLFARAYGMAFAGGHAEPRPVDAEKRRGTEETLQVETGTLGGDGARPRIGSREDMHRRSLLQAGTAAVVQPLTLAQAFTPPALTLPRQISAAAITEVGEVSTLIDYLDNKHGGGGIIADIASASMQWSAALLDLPCPDRLRPDLFAAVARLGIAVGLSAFDAYRHPYARHALKFAADCAEEADERHLRAKAFSLLARQAIWIGQPDHGLTYAEMGLVRSDRITATEIAMLHTARARAFGKLGNVQLCLSAVGQADEAFSDRRPAEDPPWMRYYDRAQHAGDTGHALYDLAVGEGQDPGRAARRLSNAVAGHTAPFQRSRAISRTKLASLLMATDDPRQAAAIGQQALDDVGRLTSRRAATDLRQLAAFATKHPHIPEAAELRRRISTTVTA